MTSEQVSCVLFIGILCMFVDIFYRLTLWFIFHIWKLVQRYNADEEDFDDDVVNIEVSRQILLQGGDGNWHNLRAMRRNILGEEIPEPEIPWHIVHAVNTSIMRHRIRPDNRVQVRRANRPY
ncbi:uncharacterized protein LOC113378484 isoform X1 [Ctenocephalides felis]|uniref:uncharacterized protein LOC113378484 isoform X1 n=1 Tax=Ctenocephalides felis TaxID=7515 RepID=UPI000E6E1D22|nr:uncharacterized protein LOC113378484 isoform X1 [Ctenocephalides felis]